MEFFRHLGSADAEALAEQVKTIPESLWIPSDEEKSSNFTVLQDAHYLFFRFV
jgi:hypothetical protein